MYTGLTLLRIWKFFENISKFSRKKLQYLTCTSDRKEWDSWRCSVLVFSDAVLNNAEPLAINM